MLRLKLHHVSKRGPRYSICKIRLKRFCIFEKIKEMYNLHLSLPNIFHVENDTGKFDQKIIIFHVMIAMKNWQCSYISTLFGMIGHTSISLFMGVVMSCREEDFRAVTICIPMEFNGPKDVGSFCMMFGKIHLFCLIHPDLVLHISVFQITASPPARSGQLWRRTGIFF